jgi:hypothetical protein
VIVPLRGSLTPLGQRYGGGGGPTTELVTWKNLVNAVVGPGNLLTLNGSGWGTAGACSVKAIQSGDGYVEWTEGRTYSAMVGLSLIDADQSYASVKWGTMTDAVSAAPTFWELGAYKDSFWPGSLGDVYRWAIVGGVMKLYMNGILRYTSATPVTYPLLVDVAGANGGGGTIIGCTINGILA